jgi:hypothetical protein
MSKSMTTDIKFYAEMTNKMQRNEEGIKNDFYIL